MNIDISRYILQALKTDVHWLSTQINFLLNKLFFFSKKNCGGPIVIPLWGIHYGVLTVVYPLWCTHCGVPIVTTHFEVPKLWCTQCGVPILLTRYASLSPTPRHECLFAPPPPHEICLPVPHASPRMPTCPAPHHVCLPAPCSPGMPYCPPRLTMYGNLPPSSPCMFLCPPILTMDASLSPGWVSMAPPVHALYLRSW